MKITDKKGASVCMLLVAAIVAACATSSITPAGLSHGQSSDLSGSQLWSQMCGLCHNAPSPKDYSDAHWEVAVMHMRVQARLTGEEERKIVQFLKASN
jgi:cytochrome c5